MFKHACRFAPAASSLKRVARARNDKRLMSVSLMTLILRRTALAIVLAALVWQTSPLALAGSQPPNDEFKTAIPSIKASFEPPTARPGQKVIWKLTMDVAPGWHTYPTKQPDPNEASKNEFFFPTLKDAVFVDEVKDPPGFLTQSELGGLGQSGVRYYEGKVVWQRPLIVRPDAKPGEIHVRVPLKVLACNDRGCLPPEDVNTLVVLKVSDGTPVAVDTKYTNAVARVNRIGRALAEVINFKVAVTPAEARPGEVVKLTITGTMKEGYHTYPITQRTKNQNESQLSKIEYLYAPGLAPLWPITEGPVQFERDADGKPLLAFDGQVSWSQDVLILPDVKPGPVPLGINIVLQVCNDKGCKGPGSYPLLEATINVAKGPAVPLTPALEKRLKAKPPPIKVVAAPAPIPVAPDSKDNGGRSPKTQSVGGDMKQKPDAAETGPDSPASDSGLLGFILQGVIWGAVSLLTPCVFPMIPITVSFFLKQSEREHHRPLGMALVYTATIVIVLTIGAVLLLGTFQAAIQYWATNLILGGLFIFFALSLFGMYEITLPSGLANFTSTRQGRGGMVGTIFMALTFSIISFSCVAPFLGGFAAMVPSFGDVRGMVSAGDWSRLGQLAVKLLLGALAFSITFAAPFFLLALFPSLLRALPKSGAWMNTLKVVMGFIEMAAAVKFFRAGELLAFGQATLLTYDLALGMYVALSLACGLYLLGLFRLPHDDPPEHLGVPRLLFSLAFLSLALYLTPGLFKRDSGESQRPSGTVFAWLDSFLLPDETDASATGPAAGGSSPASPGALVWKTDLKEGLQDAADKRRLVFVDFTGMS
jgi:thiol:disulfide interchange protein DsbD